MPRKYLRVCLLFFCCFSLFAEQETQQTAKLMKEFQRGPLHISIQISPKNPSIIDSIECDISVSVDPKYSVAMPQFGENLGRIFYILDFSSDKSRDANQKKVYSQYYKLEALISGAITIPPIQFFYQKGEEVDEETAYKAETEPIEFQIDPAKMDENQQGIYDIQGVLELRKSNINWIIMVAGSIGAILLLVCLKFVLQPPRESVIVDTRTPEEIAWEALKALMEKKYIENKDYQTFYFDLTMIVRQYIEKKHSIYASGQTTEEFLNNLAHTTVFDSSEQQDFSSFLQATDYVKYAAQEPQAEEVEKVFTAAKKFMNLES